MAMQNWENISGPGVRAAEAIKIATIAYLLFPVSVAGLTIPSLVSISKIKGS